MSSGGKNDYDKGYADGRSGKSSTPSIISIVSGALVPGVDPVGEKSESYKAGHEAGKKDR